MKNFVFSLIVAQLLSCALYAMEIRLKPSDCLQSKNPDQTSPIGIDLEMAFKYSVQGLNLEQDKYNVIYYPSQKSLDNYKIFIKSYHSNVKKNPCKAGLKCSMGKKCVYTHYVLAAYHSTDQNSVKLIWENGFNRSNSNSSMGSGVYFTTFMQNGDKNNNPGAYEKSAAYGEYTIICLVIAHDGVMKIKSSFTNESQEWPDDKDLKYMLRGVKDTDKDSTEYSSENVMRYGQKVIPLGLVYRKELKNPFEE